MIAWSTFRGKLGGKLRVGFMSQVSPDGQRVVTTINDPGAGQPDYQRRKNPLDLMQNYFVSNFKDYRFLQVFYPTRGILAWYDKAAGQLQPLPGADDPEFVHTDAVWSPDGKYLVFARAQARDAYPPGARMAERANDPNETPIQYDLYRIPFRDGQGGKAEPIAGASANGMSNSFPKVSPDGRWIVYVQARNGQLMRPDSRLFIVPAAGGVAREMRCNTRLMNSWHSFSPNGRWLVFSSKSRSPYTQMFLTHLDEDGNDSPAILIENATAANRAVNIPEFANIPPGRPAQDRCAGHRILPGGGHGFRSAEEEPVRGRRGRVRQSARARPGRGPNAQQSGLLAGRDRQGGRRHGALPEGVGTEPGLSGSAQQSRQRPAAEPPLAGSRRTVRESAGIQSEPGQCARESGGGPGADGTPG